MLIDTHCHLTFPDLAPHVPDLLARAEEAGVTRVLNVATTVAEAQTGLELLERHANVALAAGIHPHEAARTTEEDLAALRTVFDTCPETLAGRLVAVGETGLDFHYDFASPEQQERLFRAQLELACATDRPVVIHARRAETVVCDILADYPPLAGRAVFHCFSGDTALARRILDAGYLLSFTGVVTFRNAGSLRDTARFVPRDRFMVETDAPYLSPEPVRKQRPNEPALVVHTARFLAELRGEPFDELAAATTANAVEFFSLPEET